MIDPPLTLVVNADDFGIGLATSRGIIDAHLNGPVTSTSLMVVTGDRARESVALLADAPALEVGLHLVFTGAAWRPLAATAKSGLLNRSGSFGGIGALWLRCCAGRASSSAAFDEIAAEADLFRKLTGRPAAFVDGHHHTHLLPPIRRAMLRAMREGIIPPITRLTIEPPNMLARVYSAVARRCGIDALGRLARPALRRQMVWSNDWYFGVLSDDALREPFPWSRFLRHLPPTGVVEWMVHPGRPDESLVGLDPYVAGRPRELAALTHAKLRDFWPRVRRASKGQLAASRSPH